MFGFDKLLKAKSGKPIFQQNYPSFSPFDQKALEILCERLPENFVALEVGSWLGQGSTQVLIKAAAKKNGTVYCVDTWKGNINVLKHQKIVEEYDVFGTFLYNVENANALSIVKPLVMDSQSASRIIANEIFDLIFIDADHSYEATKLDIQSWKDKIKKGGILCGHDCESRVSKIGLEVLRKSTELDTINGDENFATFHPGVILATYELFGDDHQLFAEKILQLEDGRPGRSTIWYTE